MNNLKIVFMGTPEFSTTILAEIIRAKFDVVGVVTTPDSPAGRGRHLCQSAVKQFALIHHLPLWQPDDLNDPDFIRELSHLQADVFVVVAFRILPKAVYSIPPKGTFNVHASLLPQYRGAAPIQRAIMNGETRTGVTSFFIDEHTDTGDIIGQKEIPITATDTGGTLHDKLMSAGALLAIETLQAIGCGTVQRVRQPLPAPGVLKTAPKIFRGDRLIDWTATAENICNRVRALSPYPAAFTRIRCHNPASDKNEIIRILKIIACHPAHEKCYGSPGSFHITDDEKMIVNARNTAISVDILQPEGKKQMEIRDFLRGFRPENYTKILF